LQPKRAQSSELNAGIVGAAGWTFGRSSAENSVAFYSNKKGITMNKTYDRRFFAPLGFLFFLFFLGFLGTENYQHLAALAAPASLASLAALVFVPRDVSKVPPQYRLNSHEDVFRALIRRA
jgi:hypothetical protein